MLTPTRPAIRRFSPNDRWTCAPIVPPYMVAIPSLSERSIVSTGQPRYVPDRVSSGLGSNWTMRSLIRV